MSTASIRGIARESIGWSIALSLLLILLGLIALADPLFAGVAATNILAWLLIFSGIGHLLFSWHARGAGLILWEILIGIAYIVIGVDVLRQPVAGLVTLTFVLAIYLLIQGISELIMGVSMRPIPGSGWLIVNAIISLALAVMIWRQLPISAGWVVGTLVGFAMLFRGISRLALSLAARKAIGATA